MNIENIGNFGLFLAKRRYNNSNNAHYISSVCSTQYPDSLCVRLLRNFESPYLSTHLLNQKSAAAGVFCYVTIRKLIWDPRIEEEMLDDPGALLLLYYVPNFEPQEYAYGESPSRTPAISRSSLNI
ncbi:unnamed protein product [Gongylonema pulchrum]|uniref:Uncharacterized protein n=1 Tax=Gongylonema pulchrum TaxID=637853 RepID=A0A183ESX8_9BILA|nr:unnamed protein product [Gongylonema pulchrum]